MKVMLRLIVTMLLLSMQALAYADDGLSYEETVKLIARTMEESTSEARKESYGRIRFDKCILEYNVSGTYPVGDLYNITYSKIDFSGLNAQASEIGHDYTAFIILNFKDPFRAKGDFKDFALRTAVVNVSNDAKAQVLFGAFLHLGDLCGRMKEQEGRNVQSPANTLQ